MQQEVVALPNSSTLVFPLVDGGSLLVGIMTVELGTGADGGAGSAGSSGGQQGGVGVALTAGDGTAPVALLPAICDGTGSAAGGSGSAGGRQGHTWPAAALSGVCAAAMRGCRLAPSLT